MLESHKPSIVTQFDGLFAKGAEHAIPLGHFRDCKNLTFVENGCETRLGTDLAVTISSVRRIHTYERAGETPRLLILNNSGEIYDSLNLVTPILSIPGMTDFSTVTFFGRIYISPHNGQEGLPNEFIYVYDGTTCRRAGGASPTGSITVSTSGLSGFVEVGTHLFAVAFETASGFVTKPGPAIYAIYSAPGGFKVDITGIPLGPAGTSARRILATKVIDPWNGDQENQEFFYVPDGRIPDNTTTTITVDFFDADLQASADDLFFQREFIPACLHLSSFKNRMVGVNFDGGNSIALISKAADPESFSELDGFIVVDPASNDTLKSAVEFRSVLYLNKKFRMSGVSEEEGLEPAEWTPETIDNGAGTEVYGIQKILGAEGANDDKFLIATRSGLAFFDGILRHPDLTWKVDKYWERINFDAAGNTIQIFNDTTRSLLFIALPLDSNLRPNILLVGDYSDGLDPQNISWTPWEFPYSDLCIAMQILNGMPTLRIGSLNGNVYNWPSETYNDNGTGIDSYFEHGPIKIDDSGAITHCAGVRISGRGVGILQCRFQNQDSVKTTNYATTTLGITPGLDYFRRANFQAERMFIRFRTNLFNQRFTINAVSYFIKPLWAMRPQ